MRELFDLGLLLSAAGIAAWAGAAAMDALAAALLLVVAIVLMESHPSAAAVGPLVAALPMVALERELPRPPELHRKL